MEEKYIDYGKIRPTVEEGWSKDNSYERLTFVKYGVKTYISKKDVPKDIELSNEEYWLLLIDGGEIVLKEDKSNKKNSLNYDNEEYYPSIPAVKDALDNLHINNKLNCYNINNGASNNNICIKKENYSFKFILSIVDFINPENNGFYYVDDELKYTSLGYNEIQFDLCIYEAHTVDDNDNVLDTYIYLDFEDNESDLNVAIIPLAAGNLTIEQDIEGLIIDSQYELLRFNKDINLRKNDNSGGIQQSSCTANGQVSFAIGNNVATRNKGEFACGNNNITIPNKTLHTVGTGNDANNRKNAQLITIDGKHYIPGIGGFTGYENSSTQLNSCIDLATALLGVTFACNNWYESGTKGLVDSATLQQIITYYKQGVRVKIQNGTDDEWQDIIACHEGNLEVFTRDWTIVDNLD